ncbi:MAG: hypothetical protein ACLQDY_03935 [Streptosporangiaceae bacterium]
MSEIRGEPRPVPGSQPSGSQPSGSSQPLSQDELAELDRLRAETQRLKAEADRLRSQGPGPARRRLGWRAPVAVVLIVLGCILAPLSVLGVWTANQVSDTSRYVANVEPLVHDPAVQNALTDKITTEVTSHLNVTGYVDQAAGLLSSKGLPRVAALLKTFGPSLSSAVAGFIHSAVHKIVTSPRFAHAWVQVNTVAHSELVKALSGQGNSAVSVSNGKVVIGLGPFITLVKQDLAARGFTLVNKLPAINPTLTLFSARYLVKAQTAYRLINDLKIVLPILTLLLLAAGVYIARSHRRALIGAGLGFAASMLVLAAGLLIFRSIYLNSVPDSVLPANAAAAMFDTLVRFIREGLRTLLVAGLVVAAGAFLTGPSVTAVQTRRAFSSAFGWLRHQGDRAGVSTGPVGRWTYAHRRGLRIGAVALAAVVFVFWGRPTAAVVILITVLLLVVLALIELIARPAAGVPAPEPEPEPAGRA